MEVRGRPAYIVFRLQLVNGREGIIGRTPITFSPGLRLVADFDILVDPRM